MDILALIRTRARPDARSCCSGTPSALRASRPLNRHEMDIFVFFFRHRARLFRRHPRRAWASAFSRARAAKVIAEVFESVQTSFQNMKRCNRKAVRRLSSATSSFSILVVNCEDYKLGKKLRSAVSLELFSIYTALVVPKSYISVRNYMAYQYEPSSARRYVLRIHSRT